MDTYTKEQVQAAGILSVGAIKIQSFDGAETIQLANLSNQVFLDFLFGRLFGRTGFVAYDGKYFKMCSIDDGFLTAVKVEVLE